MNPDFTPQEIGKPQRRFLSSRLLRLSHLCGVKKYVNSPVVDCECSANDSTGNTHFTPAEFHDLFGGSASRVPSTPSTNLGKIGDVVHYGYTRSTPTIPKLRHGSTVTHDANGNLTSTSAWSTGVSPVNLNYDSQNRLLSVANGSATVTSTYDTRNRVTSRTINGATSLFLWDDWDLIEERDLSGTQTRRYVHGANVDEILIMVDATGAKYHHHDALGSVTALTNSSGAILETYNYDVFGAATVYDSFFTLQPSSLIGNRFLYTGREWIAEAGIYDYRNRVFSPVIGRFLQTDPILFSAGDVNVYRYVGNGVLVLNDPEGLAAPAIAAGAAAGHVVGGAAVGAGMGYLTGAAGQLGIEAGKNFKDPNYKPNFDAVHEAGKGGILPGAATGAVTGPVAGATAGLFATLTNFGANFCGEVAGFFDLF